MNVVYILLCILTFRTLDKNFSRQHFEIFFLFFFQIIMCYYQSGASYFLNVASCLMNLGQVVLGRVLCEASCLWGEVSCTLSHDACWHWNQLLTLKVILLIHICTAYGSVRHLSGIVNMFIAILAYNFYCMYITSENSVISILHFCFHRRFHFYWHMATLRHRVVLYPYKLKKQKQKKKRVYKRKIKRQTTRSHCGSN